MPNTDKKVVAIIQARMGSTRLPGKALKEIMGKTLIEWIYYRLKFAKEVDQIVLSTADNKENDNLAALAEKLNLECYRGSEKDLVSRIYETAKKFGADAILRITGDCPLVDPAIVDGITREYRKDPLKYDCITNILPPTYPDGLDVELLPFFTLERLNSKVADPLYREWITTTIMENPDKYKIRNLPYKENISHLRLTVDYPEDFQLAEMIFRKLHKEREVFCMEDVLELLRKEPDLVEINKNRVDQGIINNIRSAEFHNLKNSGKI